MAEELVWLEDNGFNSGWVDDPDAVESIVSTLEYPTFGDTPADGFPVGDLPKEVALWSACVKVTKLPTLKVQNQGNIGTCVSMGTARSIEYTNLVEIVNGDNEEFKVLNRPVIYAGSRVEVGGGKVRGDGSIGAWAAKFVTSYGVIDCGVYAGYDLNQYDIPVIREWGLKGVPDALEPYIKQHPVSNTVLVSSIEEAKKSLAQGYGISVCSNQGFTTSRDKNGICFPKGNWSHCMACTGYTTIMNKLYFFIENSWGDYMGKGNPAPMGANSGTFLCSDDVFAGMLRMRDSFSFAGLRGFEKRKLNWDL